MPLKFHHAWSNYPSGWYSLVYVTDDYGNPVLLDHENMSEAVYFLTGL
jgi:hypothetical protein